MYGRIMLKWILEIKDGNIHRIHLVQNRGQMRAIVNFRFHEMMRIPWVAEEMFVSQEGPTSMELVLLLLVVGNFD
jgi:hypothetical protein